MPLWVCDYQYLYVDWEKKYTKQLANDAWQKDALVFTENKNVEMSHVLRY